MREIASEMLGFLYPPRCPLCDTLILPGERLCADCGGESWTLQGPVCMRCGKPMESGREEYCRDCARKQHAYRQGKAVFAYHDKVRQSMYRFKYANRREYAGFYAGEAARKYGGWIARCGVEVIVPVPMYAWKQRRRGYNQAEVFARALGRELDLPVDAGIVRRIRNTVPQKELNDRQRRKNLKNAFQLNKDVVKYSQILLVDDIYTTGSTVDAVAETLLSGGATHIYCLCISIGAGF